MSEGKTEIYLDHLPRKQGIGANKNKPTINWRKSIGFIIAGIYKGEKYEFEIVDYERNKKRHLTILYKGREFDIYTSNLVKCKFGKILGSHTSEFKIKIGETFKDEKITIIGRKIKTRYKKDGSKCNDKYYKYKCNNPECGFECGEHWSIKDKQYKDELWIEESALIIQNQGCSCCSNQVIVEGINDITTTNPELVKYFKYTEEAKKYSKSSGVKIKCVCPDCGREKDILMSSLYKQQGINCPICSDGISYPNKFMGALLSELNIDFIPELTKTTFKWCEDYRYDFYIPSMNLIIEMDGALGHGKRVHPKSNKTIEETIENDLCKDRLANERGIEVIRIDCDYGIVDNRFEYIKNNVVFKLFSKFNLLNVDWIKVGRDSEKNKIKEVCKLKNNNPQITTVKIGELIKMDTSTIRRYLKIGNKLGFCNYSPKEESKKGGIKAGKLNGKKVKIFKHKKELGEYPSCSELERCSEKDFGVKLNHRMMSAVCLGKKPQYKGFTFKYIEENKSNKLHNQELVQAS